MLFTFFSQFTMHRGFVPQYDKAKVIIDFIHSPTTIPSPILSIQGLIEHDLTHFFAVGC